ncbi:helix-turn-helix transcriptional regulator [Nitrosomonas sp. Nm58]|uniref:helix-turn-helix domain-containing protein n=1 Tax=Nitrosomonas sp. Nm58 TaxID=200126 RepID=UPI00089A7FC9|nr:helix-turn-helix transcriptional regulator [Nitrosomonas sp. Nm58]SDY67849.1 hypothetical protein SAMN05421754_101747 [Nitrosomonas sp. Nm58]
MTSTLASYQTILDSNGKPTFVVVPYADFVKLPCVVRPGMIANDVAGKRMGITHAGYAQIEAAKRPRKATLEKAAAAMGIILEQLAYEL